MHLQLTHKDVALNFFKEKSNYFQIAQRNVIVNKR